jgi:peptide/nickel transport system substrate-binding protein
MAMVDRSNSRFARRSFLRVGAAGGVAALVAACSAPVPGAPTPAPAPTPSGGSQPTQPALATAPAAAPTQAAGQPKVGGVLRAVKTGDIAPIDPHYHSPSNGLGAWILYDTLTGYDDNLNPIPILAERWEQSSDQRQMALYLRQGVSFHTGRELTASDILYNLNRLSDPKANTAGIIPGFVPPGTTWEAPDKYTVVITAQQPWVSIFDFMLVFNIGDRDTLEGPDVKSTGVGTGPFAMAEWVPGDHVTYKKNPNYWQTGRPYLDGIQLSIAKDTTAQSVQFESGAHDFSLNPPITDFNRLKSNPQFKSILLPNPGAFLIIQPNPTTRPFDDKRARQALNHAIDRKRIVDQLLQGVGTPYDLPWPPGSPAYEADKVAVYDHDLDKARALFTEAGMVGTSFEMLATNTNAIYGSLLEIVQNDLKSIGVTMQVTQMDIAAMLGRMNAHQFQAYLAGDNWSNFEPITPLSADASLNYRVNNADFHDDTYTRLVSSAAMEPDAAKRKQIYSQINDVLLDQSFDIIMASNIIRATTTTNVEGIGHRRNDFFTFTDAWFS